jgi:hypothetical protein
MLTKLRRDESFSFSWDNEPDVEGDALEEDSLRGRHGTVWISKSTPLYFNYDAPRDRPLDQKWLAALAKAASASSGNFRLLPEPT